MLDVRREDCKLCPDVSKLELFTQVFLMLEKGITQVDITQAVKIYVKASNKYMVDFYNHHELIKFLAYIAANNPYV